MFITDLSCGHSIFLLISTFDSHYVRSGLDACSFFLCCNRVPKILYTYSLSDVGLVAISEHIIRQLQIRWLTSLPKLRIRRASFMIACRVPAAPEMDSLAFRRGESRRREESKRVNPNRTLWTNGKLVDITGSTKGWVKKPQADIKSFKIVFWMSTNG